MGAATSIKVGEWPTGSRIAEYFAKQNRKLFMRLEAPSPGRGASLDAGTAFVLWISIPIEVRIERKNTRKIYVKARKVDWALRPSNVEAEGQALSACAS